MTLFARVIFTLILGLAPLSISGAMARPNDKAGRFDYYSLILTWSPTYCAENRNERNSPQCSGRRPYAFVLHGLWPQYNQGYPEACYVRDRWVPKDVINDMVDIMPARGLVIHEWRKHGTCSGLAAREYFEASREAFHKIKIPARYLSPTKPIYVTPQQIERDFLKTNPDLTEDMIAISCGTKRRLREVRICLSRDLKPIPCGSNENQRRLCRDRQVVMPPVR